MGVKIRRASKEDVENHTFHKVPNGNRPTLIAWCGEDDETGEMLGFGGLARVEGRWIAFCEVYENGLKYKYKIARTAKRVMEDAKARGIKFVYADTDPKQDGPRKWAESLGFEPDPRTGILYRWRA